MSEENSKSVAESRFLSFHLGNEKYAIPLLSVKEVLALPEFTPIPHTPSHFVGIMNIRGQVISAIDLRVKFGIKPQTTEETCVIIIDLHGQYLGVIIDSVDSVIAPKENELSEKPYIEGQKGSEYVTGVYRKDKELTLILDIYKTLNAEDKSAMKKTTTSQHAA
ncbi:MAG: chemotaxis protein CheW [Pseudobdellovibrionaceae bacterium]